jgi:hypothetical protein
MLLTGAERYIAGDDAAAAQAWRPLVMRRSPFVPSEVFDRTDAHDLAQRLDEFRARRDTLAGANFAHVRLARRAHESGDRAKAREMAELVIRSWSGADVPVPAVNEMRALLAELGN